MALWFSAHTPSQIYALFPHFGGLDSLFDQNAAETPVLKRLFK
jgi:hypothetical protein